MEVIVATLLLVSGVAASGLLLAHAQRLQGDAAIEIRTTEAAVQRAARESPTCARTPEAWQEGPPPRLTLRRGLVREIGMRAGGRPVVVTLGTAWLCPADIR